MPESRCRNGHVYFKEGSARCPVCGCSLDPLQGPDRTRLPAAGLRLDAADVELTAVALRPVCGWLVCIEGTDRGRDFRLACESNFIGRAPENDVVIASDMYISRVRHAAILCESDARRFVLTRGSLTGKSVYHNGSAIHTPVELKAGDVIALGRTQLIFVPFCPDLYTWSRAAERDA